MTIILQFLHAAEVFILNLLLEYFQFNKILRVGQKKSTKNLRERFLEERG